LLTALRTGLLFAVLVIFLLLVRELSIRPARAHHHFQVHRPPIAGTTLALWFVGKHAELAVLHGRESWLIGVAVANAISARDIRRTAARPLRGKIVFRCGA